MITAQTPASTICAIATPPGVGGVGIVRVSGPMAGAMAQTICSAICSGLPQARQAVYTRFLDTDGSTIDSGLVLFFPAPHSFTGEDVLELQAHGGPVVLQMIMRRLTSLGARAARAGEFSQRAFLNDKLDLAQAEAIADLIASGTEAAARAAQQSLSGVFSRRVHLLQDNFTGLRVFVEAAIDFPAEEIDFLSDSDVLQRLQGAQQEVKALLADARQGRLLRDGIVLAIIGRPNAGKSSLLNAFSGQDSAIVTDIPGTTRDVLREWIEIGGIPVQVTDTAGIRETTDRIEAEGVRRARSAVAAADLILLIVDTSADSKQQLELLQEVPPGSPCIVVFNKTDLLVQQQQTALESAHAEDIPHRAYVSALTGAGLEGLTRKIRELLGSTEQTEGSFSARQRHVDALRRAEEHLQAGESRLVEDKAPELLAEELRLAQRALGEITGELLPDELLGAIFSSFCIGK